MDQYEIEKYLQKYGNYTNGLGKGTTTQPAAATPTPGYTPDWTALAQQETNKTAGPAAMGSTNATQAAKLASDYPKTVQPSTNGQGTQTGNLMTGAIGTGIDLSSLLGSVIGTGANNAGNTQKPTGTKPTGTKPAGTNTGSKGGSGGGNATAQATAQASTQNNIIQPNQLTYTPTAQRQNIGDYQQSQAVQDYYNQLQQLMGNQPGAYEYSPEVLAAQQALAQVQAGKPQGYESKYAPAMEQLLAQIQNPGQFKYEFNGDNIFKQYADMYTQRGKQEAADVMGQAAALTGGYGNSYAQQAANQAYDQNLTELYDRGMDLYDRAYQKWLDEQQNRLTAFNATGQMEDRAYGQWRDEMGDWQNERDYATGRYDTERGFDYDKYLNDVNNWQNNRDFAASQYQNERNFDYGQYQDKQTLAEQQYQFDRQMDENIRQFNESLNWQKLTDQQKYYADYVNAMLAAGQMPSADMLKAAGLNEADAKKLLAQISKGGGGRKQGTYVTDALGNIYLADAQGQPIKGKDGYAVQANWGDVKAGDMVNSYYQNNPLSGGSPYTQAMVANTTSKGANTGVNPEKVNTGVGKGGTAAKDDKKNKK